MWPWPRRISTTYFPPNFRAQRIGCDEVKRVANLPPAAIAIFFEQHATVARALLLESYNKRYAPSTFMTEEADTWRVGWFSPEHGCEYDQRFTRLADAATDYLLFSLGKGRWHPTDANLDS